MAKDTTEARVEFESDYESWNDQVAAVNKELVNKMMSDALDRFFIGTSPNTGEPLGCLRLEDFYAIICDNLGVDPESTDYSAYAH